MARAFHVAGFGGRAFGQTLREFGTCDQSSLVSFLGAAN